jgi:sulfatase modifying factor 1
MRPSFPVVRAALFVVLAQSGVSGCAQTPAPAGSAQVETLPDGNVRDPKPTADSVAALVAASRKNMVALAGGTFEMGDWGSTVNKAGLPFDHSRDSKPLHPVRLDGFAMGKYPVTFAEFDVFTAALGLPRINQETVDQHLRKPNNPAGTSWQGAKDYCQWLGKEAKLPIDLPTEAQWEYAARSGGKRHLYPTDNGELELGRNIPSYEQYQAAGGVVAVGAFPPNPAGFHNFGAKLLEWTNDWYAADYYASSPRDNPSGPADGVTRVVRGYFGSTEMTFRRWHRSPAELGGTGLLDGREVPVTKYSGQRQNAFRCALNQAGPAKAGRAK